jgi:hypothetical protein
VNIVFLAGVLRRLFLQPGVLQASFYTGLYCGQQVFSFQVWAGIIIGKPSTLLGTGCMNRTTFDHPVVGLQYTGAIFFNFEGVFVFHKAFSYFTV